jgi:sugar O-acyltransferase (sialic acid O-acetyltransferase NeuD family)
MRDAAPPPAKTGKLVIIGNSEIAAMAYEYFTHDSAHEVVGFAIDAAYITESTFCGLPVCSMDDLPQRYPAGEYDAFVAIGDAKLNRVRRGYFDRMSALGYNLVSYVSSTAPVAPTVKIGRNCFIFELNILQPFVEIGDNVTVWSGNHIGHRTVIEDDVFIASHVVISGFCRIGRYTFIGVNAAVANNVSIGADNFIGIGAIITGDTPDNTMWRAAAAEKRPRSTRDILRVPDA